MANPSANGQQPVSKLRKLTKGLGRLAFRVAFVSKRLARLPCAFTDNL